MHKLDPGLGHSSENLVDDLLIRLSKKRENTLVCCDNFYSLNLLASELKKILVKKNPNTIFYGDSEFEKFIADSLIDDYGAAFSELVEGKVTNRPAQDTKTVLILKNGDKLDGKEISILRTLTEKSQVDKSRLIIFLNTGIAREKIEQKIDKFGSTFYLYDAKNIKIREEKKSSSTSSDEGSKKIISHDTEHKALPENEFQDTKIAAKDRFRKLKIIFLLLLTIGFILSFNEKVQIKFFEIIDSIHLKQISFLHYGEHFDHDCNLTSRKKFIVTLSQCGKPTKNNYVSG